MTEKPGEEGEFKLQIDPSDVIVFKGTKLIEQPSIVVLNITNPTNDRQAVKVKCTSNEMFRIRPAVFAVNPNESTAVTVTFNSLFVPESGKHYFVVSHIKTDDGDDNNNKTPLQIWADHNGEPLGAKRLMVNFENEDDADEMVDDENGEIEKDEDDEKENKRGDAERYEEDAENRADGENN